jgi:hypothetical protein
MHRCCRLRPRRAPLLAHGPLRMRVWRQTLNAALLHAWRHGCVHALECADARMSQERRRYRPHERLMPYARCGGCLHAHAAWGSPQGQPLQRPLAQRSSAWRLAGASCAYGCDHRQRARHTTPRLCLPHRSHTSQPHGPAFATPTLVNSAHATALTSRPQLNGACTRAAGEGSSH